MKTTKKDFNEFKAEFNRMIELLGLKSWNINFILEDIGGNAAADITYDCDARFAEVKLNTIKVLDKDIKCFARHEAFHLLLANLYDCATKRYISLNEINQIEEQVVVTLEKLNI